MKKYILFNIGVLLFSSHCISQIVTIPDPVFKQRIIDHNPVIDTNGDGELQVTEAQNFTGHLNVNGNLSGNDNIIDITGIEAFINITTLSAGNNSISNIDITENSQIHTLRLRNNLLTSINLSQNSQLRNLVLLDNIIESIDLTNNALLEDLFMPNNNLTDLDVSQNPLLDSIQIGEMNIGVLDVSQNPLLERLTVVNCNLTEINLSSNLNLRRLSLFSNPIVELDLSNNQLINFLGLGGIDNLEFDFVQVPLLDQLIYTSTNIQNLDLSQNPALVEIDIRGNQELTDLNLRNGTNEIIDITSMFPSNFTNLDALETVCIDDVDSNLAAHILNQVGHPIIFTEDCTLTIAENNGIDVIIYPNPVIDVLNIANQDTEIQSIAIYDLNGKKTLENINILNKQIDVSFLTQGVYFIKIVDTMNRVQTKKVIKN